MTNITETQALLNWQRLHDWAEQQAEGAILGESCTNSSCPLARYLRDQTGKEWTVGPSIRPADGSINDRLMKPNWIKVMIEKTDQLTSQKSGPVTREQLLDLLDDLKDIAEPYTPTPADEALYLELLTGQMRIKVYEEDAAENIVDLAKRIDAQARKLHALLAVAEEDKHHH